MVVARLGDLANGLETKRIIVVHDLPPRERIQQELESFEVKTTVAGNTVLDARATEHLQIWLLRWRLRFICRTMRRSSWRSDDWRACTNQATIVARSIQGIVSKRI